MNDIKQMWKDLGRVGQFLVVGVIAAIITAMVML